MCYNFCMDAFLLEFFNRIRCDALTVFFGFFSFLGEGIPLVVGVLLCFWLTKPQTGERIAVVALTSLPLNTWLKVAVARPRPYVAETVPLLPVDNAFLSTTDLGSHVSFPSGHSQSVASFLSALSLRVKRVWVWIVCMLVTLLVMISRLYFGVHYPTDVIAGFLIGFFVALFWTVVYQKAYGARYYMLCAFAIASLIPLFFTQPHDCLQSVGLICGLAVFLPIANRVAPPLSSFPKRLLRIPVGALAAGAVFLVSLLFPEGDAFRLLSYFLLTGGATAGAQALFRLFRI